MHTFALGFFTQLFDVVFGEAGQGLAVVQLELLHQGEPGVLGLFEPGKDGPHRGDFESVRGQAFAAHFPAVVILFVDLDLVEEPGDVRNVDLDRPVAKSLHELVGLKLLVLGLVGVTDDDFVDVGLGELLGLDLVFLAGTQQIVEERDVELEDFDEFDNAAVGDVELAVEVEGARIALGAIFGDLAIVDVAGQLGRVLVLFVLGLEGADPDAILLREDQPAHADVVDDAAPISAVLLHPLVEHLTAERAKLSFDRDLQSSWPRSLLRAAVTSTRCS